MEAFKIFGSVFLDNKDALNKMNETEGKASKLSQTVGKGLSTTGTAMMGFATAMGGLALGMFVPFEETMAKISTLVPDSGMLKTIEKDLLKTSNELGVPASQLGEAIYQGLSSGVTPEKIGVFTKDMTKFAKAGFTEPSKAVDLATTILNSYGLAVEDTGRITDVLITTQNKGKTTIDELASSMGKVIPTAKSMGVSVEQLGAGYSLMTSKGIATAETTTYLNSMLNELGKSGTKASTELKKGTGQTFQELTEAGVPLGDVLSMLDEHAKASGLSLNDMFGSAEAGKAGMILATDSGNAFNDMLQEMENSAGATNDAFEKVDNTFKSRILKIVERVKNSFIKLGEAIIPMVEGVVGKIEDFANWLSNLDEESMKSMASMLKWTLIGGSVLKLTGSLITNSAGLVGGLNTLTGAFSGVAGATGGTAGAMISLSSALPIVAGVLGAGALALYGYKKANEDVIPSIDNLIKKNDDLSTETKEKVLAMEQAFDGFNDSLLEHQFNNEVVTQEMVNNVTGNYQQLTNDIKTNLEEQKKSELEKIQYLKDTSPSLYQQLFDEINLKYGDQQVAVDENTRRINEIMTTALEQGRAITQEEWNEINRITQEAQSIGLASTTTNELEKLALQQMYEDMSLAEKQEWASNMITKAEELFQAEKQKADESYNEKVLQINNSKTLSEQQKTDAIRIAKEERDKVVSEAKGQKEDVVKNVQQQWSEVNSYVDTGTGKALTKIQQFGTDGRRYFKGLADESTNTGKDVQRASQNMVDGLSGVDSIMRNGKKDYFVDTNFSNASEHAKNLKWDIDNIPTYKSVTVNYTSSGERIGGSQMFATGTEGLSARGGIIVGEQGAEMITPPRDGSKILNHRETRNQSDNGEIMTVINLDGRTIMEALIPYFSATTGNNNRKLGFGNI